MARSRLTKPVENNDNSSATAISHRSQIARNSTKKTFKKERKSQFKNLNSADYPYIKHSPLLLLAVISTFWTINILTTKYPEDIANFLLPNSYLAILTPVFLTLTFLSSYITLNFRRGIVLGIAGTLLLLFKLQSIQFELWWMILFLLITTLLFIFQKKQPD